MATSFSSPHPATPDSSGGIGLDEYTPQTPQSSPDMPSRRILWGTILYRPGGEDECQPGSFLSSKSVGMNWSDWLGEATMVDQKDSKAAFAMCYKALSSIGRCNNIVIDTNEDSIVALHVPRIHRILWVPLTLALGGIFLESLPVSSLAVGSTGASAGVAAIVTSFAKASGSVIAAAGSNALSVALPMASTILFMFSLRGLNSHETSKRGNWLGIVGAASAVVTVVATNWIPQYSSPVLLRSMGLFLPTAATACAIGLGVASYVQMEEMPQLVAGFHSFTGLAAVLIGLSAHLNPSVTAAGGALAQALETFIGVSVGAATFSGSVVAALKLHGTIPGRPIGMKLRGPVNGLCLAKLALLTTVYCGVNNPWVRTGALLANITASATIGAMMVLPIGGADMPVIVSLLNSLSGLATSASGFMMSNSMLVMTGALVTSSGALLSDMMCRGINRSLVSVLQGGFGVEDGSVVAPSSGSIAGEIHTIDASELVKKLTDAKKVLIVPGYGMAVARCQQQVSEIANLLRNRNASTVVFGIHPVAGRLPGHMNVLLAEASVPYDIVLEMEEVNADIGSFDLCIVLGANDIVNPTTGSDPSSPIYGMPAIEVWKCRECVVLKRSMATGYSGVENPLFFNDNSRMLFGHARDVVDRVRNELADKLPSENVVEEGPTAVLGETGNYAGKDAASENAEQSVEYPPAGVMVGFVNESIFGVGDSTEVERRVAVTPVVTRKLRMLGFDVAFEEGSGKEASFSDEEYELMGATCLKTAAEVYAKSDVVLRVGPLNSSDVEMSRNGDELLPAGSQVIVSTFSVNDEILGLIEQLRVKKVTVINMAAIPRISRAQKLDVLTSMANIAGYRAVVEAFHALPRISRPSVTASGHLPAASVFVIGTGVAGLSAVATAQSLGARVYASDVRDTTKEQIESMGATFVRIDCRVSSGVGGTGGYAAEISSPEFKQAQLETYAAMVKKVDVVICTAMVPNRKAPILVTRDMVRSMAPHSVIVDLAATAGGNCELTVPGRTILDGSSQVTIVGRTTLTSDMPQQSSTMLSHNLLGILQLLRKADTPNDAVAGPASLEFNFNDVVVRQSTLTKDGEMLYPPPPLPQPPAPVPPSLPVGVELPPMRSDDSSAQAVLDYLCDHSEAVAVALGFTVVMALGLSADVQNVRLVGDFVLSLLIGHFTVAAVTPALHTPLISVTNAISGVIATGGMLQMNGPFPSGQVISALAAIFFSLINVSGGFAITHRMLQMFKPAPVKAVQSAASPTRDLGEARRMN